MRCEQYPFSTQLEPYLVLRGRRAKYKFSQRFSPTGAPKSSGMEPVSVLSAVPGGGRTTSMSAENTQAALHESTPS